MSCGTGAGAANARPASPNWNSMDRMLETLNAGKNCYLNELNRLKAWW